MITHRSSPQYVIGISSCSSYIKRALGGGDDESSSSSEGFTSESSSSSGPPATRTIVDVTQSGGSTSVLSSGAISLTEGSPYMFSACRYNTTSQNTVTFYMNGNTTAANYNYGFIQAKSDSTYQSGISATAPIMRTTSGDVFVYQGMCGLQNGNPYIVGAATLQDSNNRGRFLGGMLETESTFTQLQFNGGANTILNNSYLKIWEMQSTPVASVSVSGASVTTLSSGSISLTEGKTYMFAVGVTPDSSGGTYSIRINGDGTSGNYSLGDLDIGGSSDSSGILTTNSVVGSTGFAVLYGYCGLLNGVPYTSTTTLERTAATTVHMRFGANWNNNESTFTQLDITSNTASQVADGSFLTIWELE